MCSWINLCVFFSKVDNVWRISIVHLDNEYCGYLSSLLGKENRKNKSNRIKKNEIFFKFYTNNGQIKTKSILSKHTKNNTIHFVSSRDGFFVARLLNQLRSTTLILPKIQINCPYLLLLLILLSLQTNTQRNKKYNHGRW